MFDLLYYSNVRISQCISYFLVYFFYKLYFKKSKYTQFEIIFHCVEIICCHNLFKSLVFACIYFISRAILILCCFVGAASTFYCKWKWKCILIAKYTTYYIILYKDVIKTVNHSKLFCTSHAHRLHSTERRLRLYSSTAARKLDSQIWRF